MFEMNKLKNKKIKSILFLIVISLLLLNSEKSFAAVVIDDEYEENDIKASAKGINTGLYENLCQYDEDWYSIYIDGSDGLELKLIFDTNGTTMNIFIYDEWDDRIMSYGSNQTDFLLIDWLNNEYSKTVFIRVTGQNNGDLYDLEVLKKVGEDLFENNDNIENAKGLYAGIMDNLCQFDDDWYYIRSINENENIEVEMNYSTDEYLEIEFTNNEGIPYDFELKERSWGKKIEWTADTDVLDVFIHVYGNSTGVLYGLDFTVKESSIPGYNLDLFLLVCVISSIWIYRKKKISNFNQTN